MKEILAVHLGHARNAEHFQFHSDVLNIITAPSHKPNISEHYKKTTLHYLNKKTLLSSQSRLTKPQKKSRKKTKCETTYSLIEVQQLVKKYSLEIIHLDSLESKFKLTNSLSLIFTNKKQELEWLQYSYVSSRFWLKECFTAPWNGFDCAMTVMGDLIGLKDKKIKWNYR